MKRQISFTFGATAMEHYSIFTCELDVRNCLLIRSIGFWKNLLETLRFKSELTQIGETGKVNKYGVALFSSPLLFPQLIQKKSRLCDIRNFDLFLLVASKK